MISTVDAAVPVVLVAQAELGVGWTNALINYGALGLWVIYLVVRDYRESLKQDKRDEAHQKRHEDNLEALSKIDESYRTLVDLLIVGFGGMKNMDAQYTSLMEKIKATNGHQ